MTLAVLADGDDALGICRAHYLTRRIVRQFGEPERGLQIARFAVAGEVVTHLGLRFRVFYGRP